MNSEDWQGLQERVTPQQFVLSLYLALKIEVRMYRNSDVIFPHEIDSFIICFWLCTKHAGKDTDSGTFISVSYKRHKWQIIINTKYKVVVGR